MLKALAASFVEPEPPGGNILSSVSLEPGLYGAYFRTTGPTSNYPIYADGGVEVFVGGAWRACTSCFEDEGYEDTILMFWDTVPDLTGLVWRIVFPMTLARIDGEPLTPSTGTFAAPPMMKAGIDGLSKDQFPRNRC